MLRYMTILLTMGLLFACKSEERLDPKLENLGRASGPVEKRPAHPPMEQSKTHPPMAPMGKPAGGEGKVHAGVVVETIDASRYTYVKIKLETGEEIWSAIPQAKLNVGQPISLIESIVMKDFESKTLKRTFPKIIFGVLNGQAMDKQHGDME